MNWMVPERKLDEWQRHVLRQCSKSDGRHRWITGFAGSGKTVLLVHLAKEILAADDRTTVCVATYTHALKDLIATGFPARYGRQVPVKTHSSLLREKRKYDWILLDEVQDISAFDLRKLTGLARRQVVVAGDMDQSIYKERSTKEEIEACLDPQEHRLSMLHRLTQRIRDVAGCVMPHSRLETATTSRMQEVQVTLAHARSIDRENKWLWENLKKHSRVGEPAVVLLSGHKDVQRFVQRVCQVEGAPALEFDRKDYDPVNEALQEHDVPLQYLGNGYGSLRESDDRPLAYMMTYHSAKGLDFETVFLPHLTKKRTFWRDDEKLDRRLLYVGLTRSRRNLFLSYHGSEPHPYVQSIRNHPNRLLNEKELPIECSGPERQTSEPEVFF